MEYMSLIMLLLWGWGIWSFITMFRKNIKVSKLNDMNHGTLASAEISDDYYERSSSISYSNLPSNVHYSDDH